MNYYEHHLGDYAKDTGHLSMLEHGAYRLLLDRYYSTDKAIPVDLAYRVCRAKSREEKAAVDFVLSEFFTLVDGSWVNKKAEKVIAAAQKKISAARANGGKGGRPAKEKKANEINDGNKPSGFMLGYENETKSKAHQAPSTKHQTPVLNPLSSGGIDIPPAGSPNSESPPLSRAVQISVLLRNAEKQRGKQCRLTSADPRVIAWADAGITDQQLLEALAMAVADREAAGDDSPVNAGFVDIFVAKVLNPPKGASVIHITAGKSGSGKPWFLSWSGIEAKAAELGLEQGGTEHPQEFKTRILAAAGVTHDELRKATVDFSH